MDSLFAWLRKHSFETHTIALVMMGVAAAALYLAAQSGSRAWILILLGLFILGNLLELAIR